MIAARGRVAMDRLAEVAVGILNREVTQVQRVLRTAAELRNGAVELDIEVIDGHDQVIQERGREHDAERGRVRALLLQVHIAARAGRNDVVRLHAGT